MLTTGTRLGPYEILGSLGAGGMGEVYRARDSKLHRDVALKVLPPLFAADPDRVARFQREAQVLASLNHPNIAAIYGLEESGGVRALVLELVEGPTLAETIARRSASGPPEGGHYRSTGAPSGPSPVVSGFSRTGAGLPLDEVLSIARQVSEALEAAHEHGVTHRDLKPANIKVRPDGTVKVLDFGLAKLVDPSSAGSRPDVTASPTMTAMATGAGIILGTAAYMSPEQARGKAVDRRADIWAFGCVLYEMLTGKRAFEGDTLTDLMAAVVRSDPDFTALPPETPAAVRSLLRRCLQKDVSRRLQHIGDARIELQEALAAPPGVAPEAGSERTTGPAAPVASRPPALWQRALPWAVAAVAVAVALFSLRALRESATASGQTSRLELNLPPGLELVTGGAQTIALSPDGTRIAFVGVAGGLRQIYVRPLDDFKATPFPRTLTTLQNFFSPDGRSIGFLTAGGSVTRLSLADGLIVPLVASVDAAGGGVWGPDDRITVVRQDVLWQVPAAGGTPTQLTTLDTARGEVSQAWPRFAPGGRVLFFSSRLKSHPGTPRIEALSLATGKRQVVVESGTYPWYVPSGHLLFFRDGAVLAVPFDLDRLEVRGSPIRAIEGVQTDSNGAPIMTMSDTGTLAYAPAGSGASRLVWVSRQGLEQPVSETPRAYLNPRLSADGRRIVVEADGDLWIHDVARATFTRLVSNDGVSKSFPVWTPDGKRVIFNTSLGLRSVDADGGGRQDPIPDTSAADFPASISPDGRLLATARARGGASLDAYVVSLNGDAKPKAVVSTAAVEGGPQFSPDGRWMAYVSDESGQMQVYLRPFPGPDRKWPVSTDGGTSPRWNGKELFYRNGNKMMAVAVDLDGSDPVLLSPKLLFEQRYSFGTTITLPNYDVTRDGQRFVMVKGESVAGRLNIVLNWFEALKRLAPVK